MAKLRNLLSIFLITFLINGSFGEEVKKPSGSDAFLVSLAINKAKSALKLEEFSRIAKPQNSERNERQSNAFQLTDQRDEIDRQSTIHLEAYKTLLFWGVSQGMAIDLLQRRLPSACQKPKINCDPNASFRTFDGTCNNERFPYLGASFTAIGRFLPANYNDKIEEPRGGKTRSNLPNPRHISSNMHPDLINPDITFTNMVPHFGQFVGHDMGFPPAGFSKCCAGSPNPHCWSISIPEDDPFYSRTREPQTCMDFTRTPPYCFPTNDALREQMNLVSSYLDASTVYGPYNKRANELRSHQSGKLRVNRQDPDLLPTIKEVERDLGIEIKHAFGTFFAGDDRCNFLPTLTVMHMLFLREHNRIAEEIKSQRPHFNEETVFQNARKILIAIWQNVIYSEFLPVLLGNNTMDEFQLSITDRLTRYDQSIDTSCPNSVVSAAYRFGHTLINGNVQLWRGREQVGSFNIRDIYFKPDQVLQKINGTSGYDLILNGFQNQNAQTYDRFITEDVSRYITPEEGKDFGSDVIARNLQRGRDHGLAPYNEYRKFCNLETLTTWRNKPEEFTRDNWNRLSRVYRNPQDIDLFTGGISELPVQGGITGATFNCLKATAFRRLRYGDRFFFTHMNQAGSFSREQIAEIRKINLGQIMCENSKLERTTKNVFLSPSQSNPWISCNDSQRDRLDISKFLATFRF